VESAGLLDRINVFPVADGDTGANMAATVIALSGSMSFARALSVGDAARLAADAALSGSRGNSGAILAEFFQGLAEDLAAEVRIGTRRFATAAVHAAESARAALSLPREGTIITVLRDWSQAVHRLAQRSDDFMEIFRDSLEAARSSLERTPDLLPELKKAGVVDAGALGFVRLIEGITQYIQHGHLRDQAPAMAEDSFEAAFEQVEEKAIATGGEPPRFRYCVEAMVSGTGIDPAALRATLETLGDSVVVAGSDRRVKAHVHSDDPAAAFRAMAARGTVERHKADDMRLQCLRAAAGRRACAVIVDSACDMPDADRLRLGIEAVPVQVVVDGESRMDGTGLSSDEFIAYLAGKPDRYPTTSQPNAASFSRKFDLALAYADTAVYVGIAEALSGTLEAGRRTANASKDAASLRVFDSRQISVAAGLVARKAAEAAALGASVDDVVAAAGSAAARVKLLVAVPNLDGLIRSGRLKGMKGLAARAFGLRPILTTGKDGRACSDGMYFGAGNGIRALLGKVAAYLPAGSPLEAVIGHVDAPDEAATLAAELTARYRLAVPLEITTVSPALAAHGGLGAVALALLLPEEKP
jgi:hypothetical protein